MINILLCGDDNMFEGMKVVVYSTMFHTKSSIKWHIFTMDINICNGVETRHYRRISDEHRDYLIKIIKYFDINSDIKFYDIEKEYQNYIDGNKNIFSDFSPYATARLLADVILEESHCLYLDCDTSVQDDLTYMYNHYTSLDFEYAAYTTPIPFNYKGEMVSGVLIFNLDKIRKTKFLEKARKNLFLYEYKYPDQMALSDAGDPYPLPQTYDHFESLDKIDYMPVIIHYTDEIEPKVYHAKERFYRRFQFNQYILDGCKLIEKINFRY